MNHAFACWLFVPYRASDFGDRIPGPLNSPLFGVDRERTSNVRTELDCNTDGLRVETNAQVSLVTNTAEHTSGTPRKERSVRNAEDSRGERSAFFSRVLERLALDNIGSDEVRQQLRPDGFQVRLGH